MKLKPGVLALIIGARVTRANLGLPVTVIRQSADRPGYWLVRSDSRPMVVCDMTTGREVTKLRFAYARAADLLPVGGEPSASDIADALIQRLPREVRP